MTEDYTFINERSLVPNMVVDASGVWNQSCSQISIYQDAIDTSLIVSDANHETINDGYVTAEEENATQYLSVLDSTNEISLADLNVNITDPDCATPEIGGNLEDVGEEQVVVFSVEGSDALYGIQVAQDEDGNFQKYQFQFRETGNGQLEAIPESIQILPLDDEDVQEDTINEDNIIEGNTIEGNNEEDNIHEENTMENDDIDQNAHDRKGSIHLFAEEQSSDVPTGISNLHHEDSNEVDQHHRDNAQDLMHFEEDSQSIDIKPNIVHHHHHHHAILVKEEQHETSIVRQEPNVETATSLLNEHLQNDSDSERGRDLQDDDDLQDEHQPDLQSQDDLQSETNNFAGIGNVGVEYDDDDNHACCDSAQEAIADNYFTQEMCLKVEAAASSCESAEDADEFAEEEEEEDELPITEIEEEDEGVEGEETTTDDVVETEDFERVEVIPEFSLSSQDEGGPPNIVTTRDSETETYQLVEGLHITDDIGDATNNLLQPLPRLAEKVTSLSNANILRQALRGVTETRNQLAKKDKGLLVYVVSPEKENVDAFSNGGAGFTPVRTNPRSILKTSFVRYTTTPEKQPNVVDYDVKMGKRFSRGKEATQARILHNFINKTTIPQEPVRKKRLPRKQQIKPVDRQDEDIIVQEVMISANGFIETTGRIPKNNFEITGFVDLTKPNDSFKKKVLKKRKRQSRKTTINISSDSDDSEKSVIEIDLSDTENIPQVEETNAVLPDSAGPQRRKRGRPPKITISKASSADSGKASTDSSPHPQSDASQVSTKSEIPCTKCSKTFPSQNSLKTHLQHHNLETCMKKSLEKYLCSKCGEMFKNNILLSRHPCKSFSCATCNKKFPDMSSLTGHKRTHIKELLFKSTIPENLTPRRVARRMSLKPTENSLRCKNCGKICSSPQNLASHMKIHKKFTCTTCLANFMSSLTLESHVRDKCVKTKSPKSKLPSPKNALRKRRTTQVTVRKSVPGRKSVPARNVVRKLACDKCSMKFYTQKALLEHKTAKHQADNGPRKSALTKSAVKARKSIKPHGGVFANSRLRVVYEQLNKTLANDL